MNEQVPGPTATIEQIHRWAFDRAMALDDRVRDTLFRPLRELHDEILRARDGNLWEDWGPTVGYVRIQEWRIWERIDKAPLLILDEVGVRKAGDWEYETLKRCLDHRDGLPTMLVSNSTPAELGRLFDARVQDRIEGGTVIEYTGETKRQ